MGSSKYLTTPEVADAANGTAELGHGLHFFTQVDLMTYGFNPLLPAYPEVGAKWRSGNPRDQQVYGVTGMRGLVKLALHHRDGSVSLVQLLK
jgi:hypothetical protein